ncbi:hypothetical protein MTO96_042840, partial [Rhipicephalus appendiculatus]
SPQKPKYSQADDIWFLETSGRQKLKAREACSIESACLHNSNYTVHLLSAGNIDSSHCPYHRVLSKLPNFRSAALSASAELAGTPLFPLYAKGGALHQSPFFTVHLSDFLRYAVIWKRGGVYLDTDVIVFKSLKGLRNSIVYEVNGTSVANGLLFFSKNHPVIKALTFACSRHYRPNEWAACGPWLASYLPRNPTLSRLVTFLPSWTFLKSKYEDWRRFFDPREARSLLREAGGHGREETLALIEVFLYLTTVLQKFKVLPEEGKTLCLDAKHALLSLVDETKPLRFIPR